MNAERAPYDVFPSNDSRSHSDSGCFISHDGLYPRSFSSPHRSGPTPVCPGLGERGEPLNDFGKGEVALSVVCDHVNEHWDSPSKANRVPALCRGTISSHLDPVLLRSSLNAGEEVDSSSTAYGN